MVLKYTNLHTHHFTNNNGVIEIVNQYPNELCENINNFSIGIHPWHINENTFETELKLIEQKINLPNCMAIGECGLDKRIDIPLSLQTDIFELHLLLAEKHNKPVIIHCVAAFNELIAIKNKLKLTIPLIIHGFSKNENVAKSLLDAGFYISFGKYIMTNPTLAEVLFKIPKDKLFLETDSSDFKIEDVYNKAASIKGILPEEVKLIIKKNFEVVFNKK